MLIDTHCHLDFNRFDGDRDQVVERALQAGVSRIIVPALELENCPKVIELAERYREVFAAVGIHPNSSAGWQDDWIAALRQWLSHEKVVAVGEIGLDYHWDKSPPEVQKRAFIKQLELAAEVDLPVIIHNREADEDVLALLAASRQTERERPGVLHSFSSSWQVAERALKMGYYLGFTGPITYKNAGELRDVVGRMPADRILVETDAPFLAPQAHRGARNEPAFVVQVAEQIATIRETTLKVIEAMTTENATCVFGRAILTN